jgi:hypothetical protein
LHGQHAEKAEELPALSMWMFRMILEGMLLSLSEQVLNYSFFFKIKYCVVF